MADAEAPVAARVRFSTARNPLGLEIGEWIKTFRTCTVAYDEDGNRKLFYEEVQGVSYQVTGVVTKALGKYVEGRRGYAALEADYDPPYLKVSHYVRLYECRKQINAKPVLIHPDDIEVSK